MPKHFNIIPARVFRITRWHRWLRHCATSQKVVGSFPDGIFGIFLWHNPSGCTLAMMLTQPFDRNEYQQYFFGSKGSWCIGLTSLPPSCVDCFEIWKSQLPGTLRACPDNYRNIFTCYFIGVILKIKCCEVGSAYIQVNMYTTIPWNFHACPIVLLWRSRQHTYPKFW
jgi:hypothetical protein